MNTHPSRPLELLHRSGGDPSRTEPLGPYVIESFIDADEEGAGTVYRVQIAPRQRTGVSQHRVAEEYYYVLSGRATALLNGQPRAIAAGDFLRLPPGMTHAFVTGEEPLEMLNVHTPGCRPDHDTYFLGHESP